MIHDAPQFSSHHHRPVAPGLPRLRRSPHRQDTEPGPSGGSWCRVLADVYAAAAVHAGPRLYLHRADATRPWRAHERYSPGSRDSDIHRSLAVGRLPHTLLWQTAPAARATAQGMRPGSGRSHAGRMRGVVARWQPQGAASSLLRTRVGRLRERAWRWELRSLSALARSRASRRRASVLRGGG